MPAAGRREDGEWVRFGRARSGPRRTTAVGLHLGQNMGIRGRGEQRGGKRLRVEPGVKNISSQPRLGSFVITVLGSQFPSEGLSRA